MPSKNENALSEGLEFDEDDFMVADLEASLEAELEIQFSDLAFFEDERAKIGNPDNLGEIILGEVWTQFGNQIGLDLTNETLIQAYDRENPEKYNKEVGNAIMKDPNYTKAYAEMKQQHENGTLTDDYTGKKLGVQDKPNLDHVVSRKELYENARRKQSNIDTKDLANREKNLRPTNESLNKSKGAKTNQQYVDERAQREEGLLKQNEAAHRKIDESHEAPVDKRLAHEKADKRLQDKLDADDTLMLKRDKEARKDMNKVIAPAAAKRTVEKAGKDALKMMLVSALFDLLKAIMNGLVRFFKEKDKSFKRFLTEMKASIKYFISHISNFARTGASSAIGTVVSEIFGPIVSTFKKLASFIKQGASSLTEAIHYLNAKENKNKPLSIKIAQVGKIVTAGLAAGGAIVGGEFIEKALLHLPIMTVKIPLLGSIANVTGMFLSSLLAGVIGATVINLIDRYIAKRQQNENMDNQIDKKNEILQTQDKLIGVKIEKMSITKESAGQAMIRNREEAKGIISEAMATIFTEDEDEASNHDRFDTMDADLADLLE